MARKNPTALKAVASLDFEDAIASKISEKVEEAIAGIDWTRVSELVAKKLINTAKEKAIAWLSEGEPTYLPLTELEAMDVREVQDAA